MLSRPRPPSPDGDGDESKRPPKQRVEDDNTLIALYNQGDMPAYLLRVYENCAPGVINFLKGYVDPEYQEAINDIFHDSFINFTKMVSRKRNRQFPLPQPFNHLDYMRKIAKHEYLKRVKKASKRLMVSLSPDEDDEEQEQVTSVENEASMLMYRPDEFDEGLVKEELRANISKLKEPYRTTLHLLCKGLSYKEIAEKMRCPVGKVKTWVYRGKKLLEKLYKNGQEG